MKTAVIVAHPDDEVIWSGGLILKHPDWDWTILALCRADDADRGPKFRRVCSQLNVLGMISDLDDGNPLKPIDPEREIGRRVLERLGRADWHLCITHGSNGEYGHERHKQVHQAVQALAGKGLLRCRELWAFAYDCEAASGACRPAAWAELSVELSAEELAEKKRIVRKEYGYGEDSFEVRACISPESFSRLKDVGKELSS